MAAETVRLLRPSQWVKNIFVLAPLVFSGAALDRDAAWHAALAFALFCTAASLGYIVNDLLDIESDRAHPVKRLRPLASGAVARSTALMMVWALALILVVGTGLAPELGGVAVAYLSLMLVYSVWLKHQPLLDIFGIATGFVLRVFAGAVAIAVPVSQWMFVTTLCLALFLAITKRRSELRTAGSGSRRVLEVYTPELLDRFATTAAIGAIIFYSLFVITARPSLAITVPIVLFGLFRYWLVTEHDASGEDPARLVLRDPMLGSTVLLWGVAVIWALRG